MRTLFGALLILAFICYLWMGFFALQFFDANGKLFSIMDLELPSDKDNLQGLIASMPQTTKSAVLNNLGIDYVFMASAYFGIAILCLMGWKRMRELNTYQDLLGGKEEGVFLQKILGILAFLQLLAWAFDVCENARLRYWIDQGKVGKMFLFEPMCYLKFGIAFVGLFTATGLLLLTAKRHKKLKEVWKKQ